MARCSEAASLGGVRPGMTLAEATALMPSLYAQPHVPADDRRVLQQLAEFCRRFSPLVGLEDGVEPECVYLDVTGLTHLSGDDDTLAAAIVRAMAQRGLAVRLAIADTLGAAWAVAHYGTHSTGKPLPRGGLVCRRQATVVPPGQTLDALRPLPVPSLRLPEVTSELLRALGILRIEHLQRIDRTTWTSRLGAELGRRWDQAMGNLPEPIPALPLFVEFHDRTTLEYPTVHAETLQGALDVALHKIAEKLFRHGLGALRLECRLECRGAVAASLSVGLFEADDSPEHWSGLFRMQMERVRLAAPVDAIDVAATQTAQVAWRQQELFPADAQRQRRSRLLAGLVDRLTGRLGPQAVLQVRRNADVQPERACLYIPMIALRDRCVARENRTSRAGRARTVSPSSEKQRGGRATASLALAQAASPAQAETGRGTAWPGSSGSGPPRPLRLIPRPLALPVAAVVPDGPPAKFRFRGIEHRIAHAWGPERIETGWWRGPTVARDYYRVETVDGFRFWLFRRRDDGAWFLQGLFE